MLRQVAVPTSPNRQGLPGVSRLRRLPFLLL
jgi:hypothetical protein